MSTRRNPSSRAGSRAAGSGSPAADSHTLPGKNASVLQFQGKTGRQRLIEVLQSQTLVAGDLRIASAIARTGVLRTFRRRTVLMRQGDQDNFIVFLLSGVVLIKINSREVARRAGGTHIGEMALVDVLARRSATVVAAEDCVALELSEPRFSRLASKYPELWRRVAVELSRRLRERTKFLTQPHDKPVIFVGSSSERLELAETLGRMLTRRPFVVRLWTDGVFQASMTSIESLVKMAKEVDFGALVIGADDVTVSRGKTKPSPRDNVVFELGLLMGSIGRERVFILTPKGTDVRLPSDLLGITCVEYGHSPRVPMAQRLESAFRVIAEHVHRIGPR